MLSLLLRVVARADGAIDGPCLSVDPLESRGYQEEAN
jgi:hypothetical protein